MQRIIGINLMALVLLFIALNFAHPQLSGREARTNQNDSRLFEQARKALNESNFAEARILFTNLIDIYPDSGYVPRAKLSIADSWYSEHRFKQAESEYRDFITFFPNRTEVAKVQRRINSIHRNTSF